MYDNIYSFCTFSYFKSCSDEHDTYFNTFLEDQRIKHIDNYTGQTLLFTPMNVVNKVVSTKIVNMYTIIK